jgi:hypothetical protein
MTERYTQLVDCNLVRLHCLLRRGHIKVGFLSEIQPTAIEESSRYTKE